MNAAAVVLRSLLLRQNRFFIIQSLRSSSSQIPVSPSVSTGNQKAKLEALRPSDEFLSRLNNEGKDRVKKYLQEIEVYVWMSEHSMSELTDDNWIRLLKSKSLADRIAFLDFVTRKRYRHELDKIEREIKKKERLKEMEGQPEEFRGIPHFLNPLRNSKHFDLTIASRFYKMIRLKNSRPQIFIDLRFINQEDCNQSEIGVLGRHMHFVIKENLERRNPFLMKFVNFNSETYEGSHFFKSLQFYDTPYLEQKSLPELSEKDITEYFPDKRRFVYISRFGKQWLDGPLDKDMYVIGCTLDYHRETLGACRKDKMDIRCLPIDKYVKWNCGPKIVPFANIIRILNDVLESNGDWKTALEKNISIRHFRTEEEKTNSAVISRTRREENRERFNNLIRVIVESYIGAEVFRVMGRSSHHSDRHRRDHDRSRSRERRHHHSDDHHHFRAGHTSSEPKTKDISKNIEIVKSHMRAGLGSAKIGNSHSHNTETAGVRRLYGGVINILITFFIVSNVDNTSAIETTNRQREIELIEDGPFRPAIFQSTDTKSLSQTVHRKQETHEKAIFGPKWRDSITMKECSATTVSVASVPEENVYLPETKKELNLAGPKFLVDSKVRQERWLKLYRERRLQLLA
uniref:SAM-dependent MTase TRM10-type domain-containing protein n=1 Tax=Syphacia muris TaxID=451379 RepID=A0A0N5AWT7_9BILA